MREGINDGVDSIITIILVGTRFSPFQSILKWRGAR
jgi:hypothetical protein